MKRGYLLRITLLTLFCVDGAAIAADAQNKLYDVERAMDACGQDVNCMVKEVQKMQKNLQTMLRNPQVSKMASTPCHGFTGTQPAKLAIGTGEMECLPLNVRIYHKSSVAEKKECGYPRERFTYAYVYETPGQLVSGYSRGQHSYLLNTMPAMHGGPWSLNLKHVEYVVRETEEDCKLTGSYSFGSKDIDFGTQPSVGFHYDYRYTAPDAHNVHFTPLSGWASPQASKAHWGVSVPFQLMGGIALANEPMKAGLKFSSSDFEALIQGETLTRSVRWTTKPNPDAYPGDSDINELEIEIRSTKTKPSCSLRITSPAKGHKLAFSSAKPGVLTLDLTAKTNSAKLEQKITWSLPQFDAATKVQVKPSSLKGSHLKVTLQGLPKSLSGLGDKVFTASVNDKNCHRSASRTVKLFFPRNSNNNPDGNVPNWFYYWKQTPAGRPRGQAVVLSYGGSTKDRCESPTVSGVYGSKFGYKTVLICDLSRTLPKPFGVTFPLLDRAATKKYAGTRTAKNIDAFAVIVLHEYEHFLHHHNWTSKTFQKDLAKLDKDKDGLLDHMEPGLNFNPTMFQTYYANHKTLKNVDGDEEWLCFEAMKLHKTGSLDKYDWAYPGNQW